jgi:hypothetical protein
MGALGLGVLLLAACEPTRQTGPISLTPGTPEYQLRQLQLQNAQSGANPGVQNPVPTAVNPGVGGIERAGTAGSGNVTAGSPTAVNPGTTGIERQGVGAPPSSSVRSRRSGSSSGATTQ